MTNVLLNTSYLRDPDKWMNSATHHFLTCRINPFTASLDFRDNPKKLLIIHEKMKS